MDSTTLANIDANIHALKSAEFGTVLGLCGQSEHLEGVRVRPFGDEFREEIGFGAIHEKFGQALS
jgi:hypothetical protein